MSGPENFREADLNASSPLFDQQYLSGQYTNQQDLDSYQSTNSQQSTFGIQADINNHGNALNMALGSEAGIEQPSPSVSYGWYDTSLPSSPPPALDFGSSYFQSPTPVTFDQFMGSTMESLELFEGTNLTPTVDNGLVATNQLVYQDMIPGCDLTGVGLPDVDETNAYPFHIPTGNTAKHSKDARENPQQHGINYSKLLDEAADNLNILPAPTRTPEDVLDAYGHSAPLPREAFMIFIKIKKVVDDNAEFYEKPDGSFERSPMDNRPIRIFKSLPLHLNHKDLNPRLHVRAELEGAETMRDIIGRTDHSTIPSTIKIPTSEAGVVENVQYGADGENVKSVGVDSTLGGSSQGESNMNIQTTPTKMSPGTFSRSPAKFRLPEHRLERMLSNGKSTYTAANHLGLLSTFVFKNHDRTILSQATIEKLGGKTPVQWLFNTTQLIDLHPSRMCLIVPVEDVCNVNGPRPIGKPLPRTLYPLPKPQRLSEDAEKAYRILHPGEPLPDYDRLLRNHPQLAAYDDKHHHFFGSSEEALQEGKFYWSTAIFQAIDDAHARGERFFVSEQDQHLLDRTFKFRGHLQLGPSNTPRCGKRPASIKVEKLRDRGVKKSKNAKKSKVRKARLPRHGDEGTADSIPSSSRELAAGEATPQQPSDLLSEPHTPQRTSSVVPVLFEPLDRTETTGFLPNVDPTPAGLPYPIDDNQLQYTTPVAASDTTLSMGEVEYFTDLIEDSSPIYGNNWHTSPFESRASDMSPLAGHLPMGITTKAGDEVDDGNGNENMSTYFGDITDREAANICEGDASMFFHYPSTPTDPGAFSDQNSFNTGRYGAAGTRTVLPELAAENLDLLFDL